MRELKDLKIGEWIPTEDDDFTIKLEEECYYSSKNQDTIVMMGLIINKEVTREVVDGEDIMIEIRKLIPKINTLPIREKEMVVQAIGNCFGLVRDET